MSPKDVPAAGGCSVFVTTISRIPMPTDNAAAMSTTYLLPLEYPSTPIRCKNPTIATPIMAATKCPPMTFLGVAATLSGTTKIVKAEDATPTTIAVLNNVSPINNININDTAANPHWNT